MSSYSMICLVCLTVINPGELVVGHLVVNPSHVEQLLAGEPRKCLWPSCERDRNHRKQAAIPSSAGGPWPSRTALQGIQVTLARAPGHSGSCCLHLGGWLEMVKQIHVFKMIHFVL